MKLVLTEFFKNIGYFFLDKSYRRFILMALSNNPEKRYKTKNVKFNGLNFVVPDIKSFLWQYHEVFFQNIMEFDTKNPNPIVFDCGANVGTVSSYIKTIYPNAKIIAFEPDEKVFDFLKGNIERNKFQNVELNKKAVWIKSETLKFATEGADSGSLVNQNNQENFMEVEAIDINDYLEQYNQIDFFKMDIEGAENTVFPHLEKNLHRIQNIFLEFHSFHNDNQQLAQILEIAQRNGFRYHIQSIYSMKRPFSKKKEQAMDNQLNIFMYKS